MVRNIPSLLFNHFRFALLSLSTFPIYLLILFNQGLIYNFCFISFNGSSPWLLWNPLMLGITRVMRNKPSRKQDTFLSFSFFIYVLYSFWLLFLGLFASRKRFKDRYWGNLSFFFILFYVQKDESKTDVLKAVLSTFLWLCSNKISLSLL